MEKTLITVTEKSKGIRLDAYLADRLKGTFSRSKIKQFIEKGFISVDGAVKKPHYQLAGYEKIEVTIPAVKEKRIASEKIPLDIVYEDDDIIVLNKPSGMVVHPAAGNTKGTIVNALLFHTKNNLSHSDSSTRPGIVHRLDKEVSGLMVVAKTDHAHHLLVEGFKDKSINRTYIAFVKGIVEQDSGSLALPIGRSVRDRKKMAVRFFNSKEALTRFKVIKRYADYTKLQVELGTGRTHQIRVHMSYMGYPIIGDTKYGGGTFPRIALYAAELKLRHPVTGKQMHFKVDLPEELKTLDT